MRNHIKFAGKCAIFILILCVSIKIVYRVIMPKYFYQEMLSTTLSYTDFYNMEKNTIDVLFLGSSISATSYIPQELYNHYGITSYNLASEKQSPVISYFWLKEALRYQQPKAVVLDCYFLFDQSGNVMNTSEINIRRALDYMKWSPVKREAIRTICELDDSQSQFSYYFPNIRYHTRWLELTENDFLLSEMVSRYDLMGYAPLADNCKNEEYIPYSPELTGEEINILPLMEKYLDNISLLCEQNDIALILTNAPVFNRDIGKYHALQKYADAQNLLFIDFNEEEVYKETDFHFGEDSYDTAHVNLWGAQKITDYIGKVLADQCHITEKYDEQWECTKASYEETKKNCELIHIEDINEYIETLKDDRYSVFISANGNYSAFLSEETISKLRALGLEVSLQTDPAQEIFYCYYAVISDGVIVEKVGYDDYSNNSSIQDGQVTYDIARGGVIKIANVNVSIEGNGLNIVVYDNKTRKVIDSVCFDTSAEGNPVYR